MKKNEYNKLSLFQDVQDKYVRAFNQVNIILNLAEQNKNFKNYMECLPKKDLESVYITLADIKNRGLDVVRKEMLFDNNTL